jgi:hypothetical protein
MYFPANMTDELQPMDLVVNSSLKSALRQSRMKLRLEFVQKYKENVGAAVLRGDPIPVFIPPKTTWKGAVIEVLKLSRENFVAPKFKDSLANCFQNVGLYQKTHLCGGKYFEIFRSKKQGERLPLHWLLCCQTTIVLLDGC